MSVNRVRDSPFRETDWDRRLDDMLDDLGAGGGGGGHGGALVTRGPGGGGNMSQHSQQFSSSSSMQQSYSYSSSSQQQQQVFHRLSQDEHELSSMMFTQHMQILNIYIHPTLLEELLPF